MSNKPKLRFKEFNDSIVECRIENVLKIKHGKDQKAIECKDGIYPILATSGEIGRTNTFLWNKPCVLIGRKGTINKPQYMDTPFWTVDTLFYSDVNDLNCAKYLYYLFNTINWKRYDESTGVPSLSAKTVERIKVIITNNKDEQKKIAEFLSKVDEVIAEREEEVKDLEKQKKGLMQKIFSQELRFTDSNNNPYPDWEEYRLKDILAQVIDNRGKTPPLADNGYPLLEIASMGNNRINYSKISKYVDNETYKKFFRGYIEYGDVLFSTVGFYAGEVSYYDKQIDCTIAQNIVGLRFKGNNSLFMTYLLSEPKNKKRIKAIEMNQAQPSIKVTQFVELKFKVPCLEEQQKIANILSKLDELIEEKKALLSDWQSFKKGLLQQMFV